MIKKIDLAKQKEELCSRMAGKLSVLRTELSIKEIAPVIAVTKSAPQPEQEQ